MTVKTGVSSSRNSAAPEGNNLKQPSVAPMALARASPASESLDRTVSSPLKQKLNSMQYALLFLKTHLHRLVGTSVGWFVWDVAFYGVYRHCMAVLCS